MDAKLLQAMRDTYESCTRDGVCPSCRRVHDFALVTQDGEHRTIRQITCEEMRSRRHYNTGDTFVAVGPDPAR